MQGFMRGLKVGQWVEYAHTDYRVMHIHPVTGQTSLYNGIVPKEPGDRCNRTVDRRAAIQAAIDYRRACA
jgi:hypothetical protein